LSVRSTENAALQLSKRLTQSYSGNMTVAAVIVAGGSGLRAGGEKPKQYQLIGGKPVIRWTLESFLAHPEIDLVQAVIGQGHAEMYADATRGLELPPPVTGGSTRQDSCRLGIESCAAQLPDKILIHDAARPFISHGVISNVIAELDRGDAVIPGLPVADTMKFAPDGVIERTVDRGSMWFVQTPQGFAFEKILEAHRLAARDGKDTFTDDAAVAEYAGMKVRIAAGDQANRKLTTNHDVRVADKEVSARLFVERPDVRTGQGIDFHVFEPGDGVFLCGVKIPHTSKLKGHSDADVAMHALTDAILGAIGESDIGQHFPPSDPQWRGVASSVFLSKAMALLAQRKGIVANVDITILAEAPRVGPHLAAMKAVLAPLLFVAPDRIAIKATTTEGMGAIGRKEGISAFATATVRLPL
jgi:2-C-methyl-D-erythritol 4-phosphate cytidylyltransferase/2-C-methyl-D-erythritol 2,4-cyclodiphosphate synthase